MTPYDRGQYDALIFLGLTKEAVGPLMPTMQTAKNVMIPAAKRFGTSVKEFMVGNPKQFGKQLWHGTAYQPAGVDNIGGRLVKRPPGLLRESMSAPTMLTKGLFYGLPAYEAGSTLLDNKGDKARRLGESVGGALMGQATWRPLGMVGSTLLDPVGRNIGGAIGNAVGNLGK